METPGKITILLIALTISLPSCLENEYENVFDEAPDVRRKAFFEQLQSTLIAPENGWIMQYFTSEESQAYNLYAAFDAPSTVELGGNFLFTQCYCPPFANFWARYSETPRIAAQHSQSVVAVWSHSCAGKETLCYRICNGLSLQRHKSKQRN